MVNLKKSKFTFVNKEKKGINDIELPTKVVGYYQDAYNRFKKNKASFVSFIIILFIMIFIIVGPFMKKQPKISTSDEIRLKFLTPKIPFLEKFGIFDGTKVIERDGDFIDSLPEGIILEIIERNTGSDHRKTKVKVDYYKYVDYVESEYSEDGKPVSRNLSQLEYEEALRRNSVIELLNVRKTDEDSYMYTAKISLFRYALNQTPEETYFWFGTTNFGKDLFTELWKAARLSILLAATVSIINLIIGTIIGAYVGYYGGVLDILFDRIIDILGALPFIAILTIVVIKYGSPIYVVILAFVATGWLGSYGRTRMQFYRFKTREYVLAARSLGAKDKRIMFKHILPNGIGLIVTSFSLAIPSFIFGEATYAYLGIIKYKNVTSMGELLSIGQASMINHPHLLIFPAIFISVLMLSFNLMGNGLRDAFNPSLRGVE